MEDFTIDPEDYECLVSLMDRHEEFEQMLLGENGNGEVVCINIYDDKISTATIQKNGWIRTNTYWRDGTTEEHFRR